MNDTKRVFLIDAMAHIYRAYFAMLRSGSGEPLRTSDGRITQAAFVFTNMLLKLVADEEPEFLAVCFDSDKPTFRDKVYAKYKENREPMSPELRSQIPMIERICEALGITMIKVPGFEADDLIGTLAVKFADEEFTSVIVSNDKDLCQLVADPNIVCLRHNAQNIRRKKPVPPIEWCDEEWVEKKFGVVPSQITDYLALTGDSVDNIPGAPGIGEKGAVKLLKKYERLENLLENAEEVSHKSYRESLLNNRDQIAISKKLATIDVEVPVEIDVEGVRLKDPDRTLAYEVFRDLEFKALTNEYADSAPESATKRNKEDFHLVNESGGVDAMIRKLWETDEWSFQADVPISEKTGSFSVQKPRGIAISTLENESYYVDLENFRGDKEKCIRSLGDILANGILAKCAHGLKRQLASLALVGITPENIIDDTKIAAYLLNPGHGSYGIQSITQQNLGKEPSTDIPAGWSERQFQIAEIARFVVLLAKRLKRNIEEDGLKYVYQNIELPLIPVLVEMEKTGIAVDKTQLENLSETFEKALDKLEEKIFDIAGREFKVNSPKQVGEIFEELGIETHQRTRTGQISTSKDVLIELAKEHKIADLVMGYRELDKLKSSYADALPKLVADDGRIHSTFNQTVAATGRLSSTDPGLQNIPVRTEQGREIRKAFISAPDHKFISADYSQLELRILAHISKDERMLEAFRNGEDIHKKTAELVFGASSPAELKAARRKAKIVNFGIAYAVQARGLSQRTGLTYEEAKQVIENYFEKYPGVREYVDKTPMVARKQGYVATPFGRRRYLPAISSRNFNARSAAEREAINHPIQGCASDIAKLAMVRVFRRLKAEDMTAKILLQIHDELLLEVPETEISTISEILKYEMENAVKLEIPLVVDISVGETWADLK